MSFYCCIIKLNRVPFLHCLNHTLFNHGWKGSCVWEDFKFWNTLTRKDKFKFEVKKNESLVLPMVKRVNIWFSASKLFVVTERGCVKLLCILNFNIVKIMYYFQTNTSLSFKSDSIHIFAFEDDLKKKLENI